MKVYKIINTDIMLNGKIFSEGSTIELDDKDAKSLLPYLVEVENTNSNETIITAKIDSSKTKRIHKSKKTN